MLHWIQRILVQIPSPIPPYRVLDDIPPLQRIVVPVTVIIQPRLLIVLLPWQTVRLVQVMRVFLIQQVSPLIILPAHAVLPSSLMSASGRPRWSQW
ncbi:hypothetical protein ECZU03_49320 [Escherichia coli]|nr:hypothetical protein ECZU03_49320 [Escherichia coli]